MNLAARLFLFLLILGAGVPRPGARADEVSAMKAELARTKDGAKRVALLVNLSYALGSNDPEAAVRYALEAKELAVAQGDRDAQADAALNLSGAQFRRGEYDLARAAAEEARMLFHALGERSREASAVLNLGNVSMARNAWVEAIARYEESLALGGPKPDPGQAAMAYANIGGCWTYLGDLAQATENQERALSLYRVAKNPAGEASSLLNLGVIAFHRGDYPAAIARYTESMTLSEKLGDLRSEAAAASGLATILVDQNRLEDAVRYLTQCIALSRQTSDKVRLSMSLVTLSTVRQKQQRPAEARAPLLEAVRLGEELGDVRLIGLARANLGDVLMDEKQAPAAVPELEAAEKAVEQAGDEALLAMVRVRLAKAYRLTGQTAAALEATRRSVASAEKTQNKRTLIAALDESSAAQEMTGDLTGALRDARRARTQDKELLNETTAAQIAEAQTRFETEKKSRQIEVLERDRRIQNLAFERQRLLRNSALAGLALLFALVVVALNAYRIKRNAARSLSEKNIRLGEANEIIAGERAKSDKLLLSILPPTIAAQLKESTGTIANSYPHATVLFADLVGFTVFSQSVSPEELVRLLDGIFTRFDHLAEKHGVEKIKTIGDCYMVVAGLPEPVAEHCERIARMALEMHEELRAFNLAESLHIELRSGFHTGPVVAGVIGRQKFIYDLWGDTVNTASRMESSGVPGRIQVSEKVARQLDGKFTCAARGEIEVKGKGRLATYFLQAAVEQPEI